MDDTRTHDFTVNLARILQVGTSLPARTKIDKIVPCVSYAHPDYLKIFQVTTCA